MLVCVVVVAFRKLLTSCIDPPKIIITLWLATSFGFLMRSAASARWNSAKLRITEFAVMITIDCDCEVNELLKCGRKRGVGVLKINSTPVPKLRRSV